MISDAELIAACLKEDKSAWKALISRYQSFIFGVALRRGLSTSDAEDVFQNVCIKLYRHLAELRNVQRLSSWLGVVTHHEAAQLFRHEIPLQLDEGELRLSGTAEWQPMHENSALTPEQALLAWERQQLVSQTFLALPDECRQLLTMLYAAEPTYSYADVAKILALPVGSIGPKRARCLARLRVLLKEFGY